MVFPKIKYALYALPKNGGCPINNTRLCFERDAKKKVNAKYEQKHERYESKAKTLSLYHIHSNYP